jgi:O-antigen/teichoic acid export membrane protein
MVTESRPDTRPEAWPQAAATTTEKRSFASGARLLSIGIASTGLFTFAYLATASHVLSKSAYSRISLCWSIMFVILSVIYRPIEQLLSRTIADRDARGTPAGAVLRTPALIQMAFAGIALAVALALRREITRSLFGGSSALYAILVIGVLAYAASYFARGWLAGHRRFALYGGLVFLESTSRFLFALAVAVGVASGQTAVAAGMAAAPFVSLCVIPFAFRSVRDRPHVRADGYERNEVSAPKASGALTIRHGSGFAASVVAIMFSEQTLLNAGVIVVAANSHFDLTSGLTGFVFNVLLIVRAPLQLFQAVQTSILPHLTEMEARASVDEFRRTVRRTMFVTSGFGLTVALGLLAVGPTVMRIATGDHGFAYQRLGLAAVGLGMGLHLTAGTLNQALLARGRAGRAAAAWLTTAAAFVLFVALPTIANEVTRVEVGYCGAAALLTLLLWLLYRSPSLTRSPSDHGERSRLAHLTLPLSDGALYIYMAIAALALAFVSMTTAATPSYDPWSWLVWGREILHGTLSTVYGPTWKPLPVLFTTVFALFGHLQPNLWLLVARWGAALSVFMSFKLAARVVASMREPLEVGAPRRDRIAQLLPAVLAGLVAATGVAFSGGYLSDSLLGYSEGLAVAFGLIAIDRALDGHHRQAFLAGIVVAWDRPESWVLWGPYGLWLLWRDPGARKLVISAAALTLIVWFLPQKLGGGSFASGVSRAHTPRSNSAAFGSFPFYDEFRYHAWDSVFTRAKGIACLGILASFTLAFRSRRDLRGGFESRRNRAVFYTGLFGVVGLAWWALISLETQLGFSGNDRYLVFGSTLLFISLGASVGWATITLLGLIGRRVGRAGSRALSAPATFGVSVVLAFTYAFLPSGWVGRDMVSIGALRHALHYQARLRIGLATLIDRAGGYKAVVACGPVMVENFQVPMAAWYLHLRIRDVQAQPVVNANGQAPGKWPATVFQDANTSHGQQLPLTSTLTGWEQEGARYQVNRTLSMTMYRDCAG